MFYLQTYDLEYYIYPAMFSLLGITKPIIAPMVLALNTAVSDNRFGHFIREGFFRKELLLPFEITSIPASFVGGVLPISRTLFVLVLGVTLIRSGR